MHVSRNTTFFLPVCIYIYVPNCNTCILTRIKFQQKVVSHNSNIIDRMSETGINYLKP